MQVANEDLLAKLKMIQTSNGESIQVNEELQVELEKLTEEIIGLKD